MNYISIAERNTSDKANKFRCVRAKAINPFAQQKIEAVDRPERKRGARPKENPSAKK